MDTRESNLAWIIAGILLILLIIVGYLWLSSRHDLGTVLQNGKTDIAAEREQIRKDCVDPQSQECRQDLSDLEGILQEFSEQLDHATTTDMTATTTVY